MWIARNSLIDEFVLRRASSKELWCTSVALAHSLRMIHFVAQQLESRSRRRASILDSVEREYAANGWERITLEHIARCARVSRALLYIYFRDKRVLHLAIVERALQRLHLGFHDAEAGEIRGRDKVDAMARAFVSFAAERPHHLDACLRFQALPDFEALQSMEGASCLRLQHCILHSLRRGLEMGYIDGTVARTTGDSKVFALSIWAFLQGSAQIAHSKARTAGQPASSQALIEQSLALLQRMLHCSSMTS
jgi:TetR/AcrR family transcriptional regulator